MSGQSVLDELGLRAASEGVLIHDYAGVRHYCWNGTDYFVPEHIWHQAEDNKKGEPEQCAV